MFQYTVTEWLFFFYFYCFFGWVFESTYVSILKRKLVNRGFLRGPFLPIYGSGAIMMLVVSRPFSNHIVLTWLAGCVGATLLELVTGMTMEALFKVRYWDYSNQKWNYKGHICLSSTIAWGFLTIFMTEFLHRGVEKLVFSLPEGLISFLTVMISVIFLIDLTLSVKAALDLRDVLAGLSRAREEMERIQKRLDVLIAVASDELEARKQEKEIRTEELMSHLEERFRRVKERITEQPGAFLDDAKLEISELLERYLAEREYRRHFARLKDFYQRNLIKGNPTMRSARFGEALEELKKTLEERKQERKEERKK